jgi:hypothetical protein
MNWAAVADWGWGWWRGCKKLLRHFVTGRCEIERICSKGGYHTSEMSTEFATSLYYSRHLKQLSRSVFSMKLFSVSGGVDTIVAMKSIPTSTPSQQLVAVNIAHCLHALKFFNVSADKTISLKDTIFDPSHASHAALLESFWTCMRPGMQRSSLSPAGSYSLASEDWGQVGFQGADPATDFRGMGLLGLFHLEYFARTRPREARAALLNSNHSRRYYPFAATGINVTAFVLDLMRSRCLHGALFKTLEVNDLLHGVDAAEGPSSCPQLVELGFDCMNDIYCEIFIYFDALWTERDPQDVMAFPSIFAEVKEFFKTKYPQLGDKGHSYYYHN